MLAFSAALASSCRFVRTIEASIPVIGRPVIFVAVIGVVYGVLRLISGWIDQREFLIHPYLYYHGRGLAASTSYSENRISSSVAASSELNVTHRTSPGSLKRPHL